MKFAATWTSDKGLLCHDSLSGGLFVTQDGTISGWNQAAGNTALLQVDNSTSTADNTILNSGAI
jgi:hypothetical protein